MRKAGWAILLAAVAAQICWRALKLIVPYIIFRITEQLKQNHDTLLCRAREPCNLTAAHFTLTSEELAMNSVFSPELSPEEFQKIYALWERRFAARRQRGSAPLILHVGPADIHEELEMYRHTSKLLADGGGRTVFVEPHPYQRARLRERWRVLQNGSNVSMSVLPVAVCPSSGDSVVFYKVSDRFFRDFEETGWLYLIRYWAGLDKQHLLRELQVFCDQTGQVWFWKAVGIFPEHFPSTEAAWLPYIEELPVRCHTPSSLLEEIQAPAEAVDILITDAEGYDTELVGMFMEIDGFAPSTVMFEWHLHANEPPKLQALLRLVRSLHARGYDVHRHQHDVVAVAA